MDTGKKKSMAAVICIFLIFVTFASLFYVAREEDHNCTGKDCPDLCLRSSGKAGPSESGNNTCSRIFCQSGDLYRRNCYFAGVLDHFVDFVSSSKGKIK